MHKVGMRLICINIIVQNMEILNQNVMIYIMLSYFFVSVQKLHKQASECSSRVDAKFCSHYSGGHF